MPTALSSAASARANRSASAASPLRPSVAIGGHSVNGAFSRATRPAFLIDADPERQVRHEPRGLVAELGDLLRLGDVAGEQDHAAEAELARQRSQFDRQLLAVEAGDQQLADLATASAMATWALKF